MSITLPFDVQLYDSSSTQFTVTTNGLFTIGDPDPNEGQLYTNVPLPTDGIPDYTAAVFWEDLAAVGPNSIQGIYYQYEASGSGYVLYIEYYLQQSGAASPPPIYDFIVAYDSNTPGTYNFYYFLAGDPDLGADATVGVQGTGTTEVQQFEYDSVSSITPGLLLTFTTAGTGAGSQEPGVFNPDCYPPGTFPAGSGATGCSAATA